MRHFALLLILLAGCSSTIGESPEGTADARPIDFRDPPEPKEGSGTAAGCEGVTARGECQQGTAVYCDLDRGRLRKVDCEALGSNCILDIGRGAVCTTVDEDPSGGGGSISACTDTNISEEGYCTTEGTAVYCDTSGSEPVTRTWDCKAANMECAVSDCAEGAYCCGEGGGQTDPGNDICAGTGLDFDGTCDGEVARWCDPLNGVKEKDCAAAGQRCETDTCATGAYCCGEAQSTGDPEADECAELGFAGICPDDNTVRYCFNDEIQQVTCAEGKTCQVDACINGAGCCDPPEEPTQNMCTTLGIDGACKDSNTVQFCLGSTDEDIITETCEAGQECQVDTCGGGAYCCDVVDPCENLDALGVCDGEILKYCLSGEYTERDCVASGKFCVVDDSGFANCED